MPGVYFICFNFSLIVIFLNMCYLIETDNKNKNLNCPMHFRRLHFYGHFKLFNYLLCALFANFYPSRRCQCLLICCSVSSWCPAGCTGFILTHIGSFEEEEWNFKICCLFYFLLYASCPLNLTLLYTVIFLGFEKWALQMIVFFCFSEKCGLENQLYFQQENIYKHTCTLMNTYL